MTAQEAVVALLDSRLDYWAEREQALKDGGFGPEAEACHRHHLPIPGCPRCPS